MCAMCTANAMLSVQTTSATASLRTDILDFRDFDSSRILISRGGILMSTGISPEVLGRRILAGIILVGGLGAC